MPQRTGIKVAGRPWVHVAVDAFRWVCEIVVKAFGPTNLFDPVSHLH